MYRKKIFLFVFQISFIASLFSQSDSLPYLLALGVAQDGGYPHIACKKGCCAKAFENCTLKKNVVSLALVDPKEKKWWLFEATPDITLQLELFKKLTSEKYHYLPAGIFITHAHIGHYAGLMYLGKEAMGAKEISVYAMPRMLDFLKSNGPWSQLVNMKNIKLMPLKKDSTLNLSENLTVNAFTVPHRDEYSETVGFYITSSVTRYLFIPDIDKWEKWDKKLMEVLKGIDVALLDATFFDIDELPNRNIKEVPHPLVSETMELFKNEPESVKKKIYFIHFNHTNPLLWSEEKRKEVTAKGFKVVQQGDKLFINFGDRLKTK